jgi:hypothetical protein
MMPHTRLTLPYSLFLVQEIWAGLGISIFGLEEQVADDIDQRRPPVVAGGQEQEAGASAGDKIDLTHLSSQSSKGEKSAEACYIISSDSSQEVCAGEAVRGSGSLARRPEMPEHMRPERGEEVRVEKQDVYKSAGELSDSCEEQASISSNTTPRVVRAGGCGGVSQRHRCEDAREGNNWDTCSQALSQRLPSISTSGSDLLDSAALSQDAEPRVAPTADAIAAGTATAEKEKAAGFPLFRTYARCKFPAQETVSMAASEKPSSPETWSSLGACKANERHPKTEQAPWETSTKGGDAGKPQARLLRRTFGGVFSRVGAD